MAKRNNTLDWSNIPEKSQENMESAEILFENKKYTSAISRMYYALFQLIYKEMLDLKHIKLEDDIPSIHEEAYTFLQNEIAPDCDFVTATFKNMRGARRKADYIGECYLPETTQNMLTESRNLHKKLLSNVRNGRKVLYGYTNS